MYRALVLREQVPHQECFRAQLALESLPGVSPHVRLEIVSLRERSVAICTLVWFFPRVGSHVHRQIIRSERNKIRFLCLYKSLILHFISGFKSIIESFVYQPRYYGLLG